MESNCTMDIEKKQLEFAKAGTFKQNLYLGEITISYISFLAYTVPVSYGYIKLYLVQLVD